MADHYRSMATIAAFAGIFFLMPALRTAMEAGLRYEWFGAVLVVPATAAFGLACYLMHLANVASYGSEPPR